MKNRNVNRSGKNSNRHGSDATDGKKRGPITSKKVKENDFHAIRPEDEPHEPTKEEMKKRNEYERTYGLEEAVTYQDRLISDTGDKVSEWIKKLDGWLGEDGKDKEIITILEEMQDWHRSDLAPSDYVD